MPNNEDSESEQAKKTGVLVAALNMALLPIFYVNSKLGLGAAIALNTVVLYECHEVGKSRRPFANAANGVNTFFSSPRDPSSEIDNAYKNIVNGGDVLFDDLSSKVGKNL